jgi:dephospho-CoA kinase
MLVVGLTGSIASGKSETVKLLNQAGIPVFDSDAEVHKIYKKDRVVSAISRHFPSAVQGDVIDREKLGKLVLLNPKELKKLESLIHPEVRLKREKFIEQWKRERSPIVFIDIPLLFETGEKKNFDQVVVVSASDTIRQQRALSRPGMSAEKLAGITARQMPDVEKRKRADFVIENSGSLDQLREQVDALIIKLNGLPGAKTNA